MCLSGRMSAPNFHSTIKFQNAQLKFIAHQSASAIAPPVPYLDMCNLSAKAIQRCTATVLLTFPMQTDGKAP